MFVVEKDESGQITKVTISNSGPIVGWDEVHPEVREAAEKLFGENTELGRLDKSTIPEHHRIEVK